MDTKISEEPFFVLFRSFVKFVFSYVYLMMSAKNADKAKAMAKMIVVLKVNFSKPRRVWWLELKLSPSAPPRPDAVCCIKTPIVRSTAKVTCM